MAESVTIGCPSGFWGDSAVGAIQLVEQANIQYLMMDYLAEVTMSLLVRARAKDSEAGFARDFVSSAMANTINTIVAKNMKVVTNAGGVNVAACARALSALCDSAGVKLKIATISGDDVMELLSDLDPEERREMFSGAQLPAGIVSANAYLGAVPIKAALDAGADVVITGRCADSALALGILMHEFGWKPDDWDKMAAGSLAGHILECGAQVTGGLFTDWDKVPGWANIGYPIAECKADGSFTLGKAEGTGGLVTPGTVAEQMLYEIGNPSDYVLPDVIADFSAVTLTQVAANRVRVDGARGRPATATHKVSCTWTDGWRATANLTIIGPRAAEKARRTAAAILERSRFLMGRQGFDDFSATNVEILGAEDIYGPHSRAGDAREVVMRISVMHQSRQALDLFAAEIAPAGTNYAPGTTGYAGGRPKAQPVIRLFSILVDKQKIPPASVVVDGKALDYEVPLAAGRPASGTEPTIHKPIAGEGDLLPIAGSLTVKVPLLALAYGRSGDKGDKANIAIIARQPSLYPLLRRELTATRVAEYFAHLISGSVERYEAPGVNGLNFLLDQALGGGGIASLRNDAQGKSYAQMAMDMMIDVPEEIAAEIMPG